MSEKPIIFSTEMVKAILDGRKTVTRRVIKPQPEVFDNAGVPDYSCLKKSYQKGDILWVKETWGIFDTDANEDLAIAYKSQERTEFVNWICQPVYISSHKIKLGHWKSSRFMPKWAARMWLEVLDVRPERLQEITNDDAIKEGISRLFQPEDIGKPGISDLGGWTNYLWHGRAKGKVMEGWHWQYSDYSLKNPNAARKSFSSLWQFINAKRGYSWESNPWVWRIEFKRIEHYGN